MELKSWVADVVSRWVTEHLAGLEPIAARPIERFARIMYSHARAVVIGDRMTILSPGEFEVWCVDRFLRPGENEARAAAGAAGAGPRGRTGRRSDGRDRIIAELLGTTVVSVQNQRSRYRKRLEPMEGNPEGHADEDST